MRRRSSSLLPSTNRAAAHVGDTGADAPAPLLALPGAGAAGPGSAAAAVPSSAFVAIAKAPCHPLALLALVLVLVPLAASLHILFRALDPLLFVLVAAGVVPGLAYWIAAAHHGAPRSVRATLLRVPSEALIAVALGCGVVDALFASHASTLVIRCFVTSCAVNKSPRRPELFYGTLAAIIVSALSEILVVSPRSLALVTVCAYHNPPHLAVIAGAMAFGLIFASDRSAGPADGEQEPDPEPLKAEYVAPLQSVSVVAADGASSTTPLHTPRGDPSPQQPPLQPQPQQQVPQESPQPPMQLSPVAQVVVETAVASAAPPALPPRPPLVIQAPLAPVPQRSPMPITPSMPLPAETPPQPNSALSTPAGVGATPPTAAGPARPSPIATANSFQSLLEDPDDFFAAYGLAKDESETPPPPTAESLLLSPPASRRLDKTPPATPTPKKATPAPSPQKPPELSAAQVGRVQRIARTWLANRRSRLGLKALIQAQSARTRICQELLETEENYCRAIGVIQTLFVQPLREQGLLTPDQLQTVFSNAEMILNVNRELLKAIQQKLGTWSPNQTIADVFIKMAPYLKMYAQYVSNYENAVATVTACRAENKPFDEFLSSRKQEAAAQGLDLFSFLIMPVQRIPRYRMLLQELLKATPTYHPDHPQLIKAVDLVADAASHVNEHIRHAQNTNRIIALQERLKGDFDNLVMPHRKLVREGKLLKVADKGTSVRLYYLFNDVVVYTKRVLATEWYCSELDLGPAWIKDITDSDDVQNAFLLVGAGRTYILQADAPSTKAAWMADFQRVISELVEKNPELKSQRCGIQATSGNDSILARVMATPAPAHKGPARGAVPSDALTWSVPPPSGRQIPKHSDEDAAITAFVTTGAVDALLAHAGMDEALLGAVDSDRKTLLHWAARNGLLDACRLLIERMPRLLTAADRLGAQALHAAVRSGLPEVVELVASALVRLEHGLDAADAAGLNALHVAFLEAEPSVVSLLIEMAPELLSVKDRAGRTPLAYCGHLFPQIFRSADALERAIEADPTFLSKTDTQGKTPLHFAASAGMADAVRALLDKGTPLRADATGRTALMEVCDSASVAEHAVATASVLLERGGDDLLAAKDARGRTALHLASRIAGSVRLVRALLSAGANPNEAQGDEQSTPLHLAVAAEDLDVCKALVDAGGSLDAPNAQLVTPLQAAADVDTELFGELLVYRPMEPSSLFDEVGSAEGSAGSNGNSARFCPAVLSAAKLVPDMLVDAVVDEALSAQLRAQMPLGEFKALARSNRPAMVVIDRRNDRHLHFVVQKAKTLCKATPELKDKVLVLAVFVTSVMGGSQSCEHPGLGLSVLHQREIEHLAGQAPPVVMLGQINHGTARHRALLFKYLADQVGIPCALVRGGDGTPSLAEAERAFNVVNLDGVKWVIDVLHDPTALYPWASTFALRYISTGRFEDAASLGRTRRTQSRMLS